MSLVGGLGTSRLPQRSTTTFEARSKNDAATLSAMVEPPSVASEKGVGACHLNDQDVFLGDDKRVYLSTRQREILSLLADGMSNKEIAKFLSLAEGTVKSYRKTLYQKLQVCRRSQAVTCSRTIVGQAVQKFK